MNDTQIFEPEGRAIPYAVEGEGPALVLIAGQGLDIATLGVLGHSVSQEDFRVVRIGSRRPMDAAAGAPAVSMRDLAADVVDVMDHLAIKDAWVGGHAFGGTVARAVSLAYGDRVNGVLLLAVEAAPSVGPADFAGIPQRFLDPEVEPMQIAARNAASLAPLAAGVPVLVLQGTEDAVTPVANGEALKASAPDRVSVVAIEGGTHMFPATHIGATSLAIEDYLDWD
ncbi:MAG: alpha/beta hydrolase [Microbacteriaceae bacterium]|jgi:pimeloyl-ACP methyl ester carboxylesterase|nr:alpha/beta hydrolase [Microbacteriaceae bacterium]HOA86071.1 alpha/beta hydrolase [Microbacteriaceae bacterium]HPZ33687.1 alpha/beta hydrolase [Microbacteriaceae bacterium]HQC93644.1 alpha/beta hydrolase [Microbacteriaceae bacterium]